MSLDAHISSEMRPAVAASGPGVAADLSAIAANVMNTVGFGAAQLQPKTAGMLRLGIMIRLAIASAMALTGLLAHLAGL
jgi:hypothetical protein